VSGSIKDHRRCSKCGSPYVCRSRTRLWERPLRFVSLRPYRCRDCGYRSFALIRPATRGAPRSGRKRILVYGLLVCLFGGAILSLRHRGVLAKLRSIQREEFSALSPVPQASPPREANPQPSPPESPKPANTALKPKITVRSAEQPGSDSGAGEGTAISPPEAIRAQRPNLPANIQSAITSDNTVEVRVRIDRSGRVTGAEPVSVRGFLAASLAPYAVDAARHWRFRPARSNGKPVRSERVLEFLFRPSDS